MIDLNDENIKNYFNNLIDNEISNINVCLNKQKELSSQVLACLNNFPNTISPDMDVETLFDASSELVSISKLLNKISLNFSSFEELLDELNHMKQSISIVDSKTINDIVKYNKTFTTCIKQISANVMKIERFIMQNSLVYSPKVTATVAVNQVANNIQVVEIDQTVDNVKATEVEQIKDNIKPIELELIKNNVKIVEPERAENTAKAIEIEQVKDTINLMELVSPESDAKIIKPEQDKSNMIEDNIEVTDDVPAEPSNNLSPNTLIISEIDEKVVLPYTIEDLTKTFKDNPDKYKSLEEVIDKLYTKPIKYYKNSSTARFKEAYNLIRKKESGSIGEAFDLGMELFSNYNLHPAIITACKNIDELDIYLSCLDYNELDDFKFFKIIYNVAPATKGELIKKTLQKGKHTKKGITA